MVSEEYGKLIQLSGKEFRRNCPMVKNVKISKSEYVVEGFCIKGEIHVLVRRKNKLIILKKYSQIYKTWKNLIELKDRQDLCASVLIGKIYIVGGIESLGIAKACTTCIQYDTKLNNIKSVNQKPS